MAMCAEADAMVGAVYDAMQELGLGEETYFVFSSDHGEMALEHQDWYKMTLYEGSVRVPLVMAGPGIQPGQRLSNLVSLIDVCPTFIEMGGLAARRAGDWTANRCCRWRRGKRPRAATGRWRALWAARSTLLAYMLRKGRWKYVAYVGYAPQLFDIENDPGELIDLSADASRCGRASRCGAAGHSGL